MTSAEEKSALRQALKKTRMDAFSLEKSELICHRILSFPHLENANTVLCYAAVQGEAALDTAVENFLKKGIGAAFPISGQKGIMSFHEITALSDLKRGRFGVPEPPSDSPIIEKSSLTPFDICLVPAIAYDRGGYRLGYGGGYYDRFLADFKGIKIGIAFDASIVPSLPKEENDIKVDYIITESRVEKT